MPGGRPTRASVYARLDQALVDLGERLGGLPSPEEAGFAWRDIWHLEAHHSTALEGNTLVIREVEELLERGRAVGAKPLRHSGRRGPAGGALPHRDPRHRRGRVDPAEVRVVGA